MLSFKFLTLAAVLLSIGNVVLAAPLPIDGTDYDVVVLSRRGSESSPSPTPSDKAKKHAAALATLQGDSRPGSPVAETQDEKNRRHALQQLQGERHSGEPGSPVHLPHAEHLARPPAPQGQPGHHAGQPQSAFSVSSEESHHGQHPQAETRADRKRRHAYQDLHGEAHSTDSGSRSGSPGSQGPHHSGSGSGDRHTIEVAMSKQDLDAAKEDGHIAAGSASRPTSSHGATSGPRTRR